MVYSVFLRDVAPWVVYREAQAKRWSLTACPVDIWTELDSVNECVRAPVNNTVDIDTGTSGLPSPRINDSSNISISLLRDGADKRSKLLAGRPLCRYLSNYPIIRRADSRGRPIWPYQRWFSLCMLCQAFPSCRRDYCNSLLYSASDGLISTLKAAARLITSDASCIGFLSGDESSTKHSKLVIV